MKNHLPCTHGYLADCGSGATTKTRSSVYSFSLFIRSFVHSLDVHSICSFVHLFISRFHSLFIVSFIHLFISFLCIHCSASSASSTSRIPLPLRLSTALSASSTSRIPLSLHPPILYSVFVVMFFVIIIKCCSFC